MKWRRELDLAADAALAAAELLAESFAGNAGVESREGRDIKTRADVEAEALIVRRLAGTGIPVLGEEEAKAGASATGMRWLVDPLDGTMNFTRGFPMHAVSVAMWDGMKPVIGVIYDVSHRTVYTGCAEGGAWRNGQEIKVSSTAECRQSILATGFPTGRDYEANALGAFITRVQAFKKVRMIGSAALSLAMVASGVFDAYFEEDIMIWDVAAGLALVQGAGGSIVITAGRSPHSVVAVATNNRISV